MNNDIEKISVLNTDEIGEAIAQHINTAISNGKKVLWLISGGSSIPVAVAAAKALGSVDQDLLRIGLVDEKFTAEENLSNGAQLTEAGFTIDFSPIILPNVDLDKCGSEYETYIKDSLGWADMSIGQFGIGNGYHTGGIVAGSPAITDEAYVTDYSMNDERHITLTTRVIEELDIAIINSTGEAKRSLVAHFIESDVPIEKEPTQALKRARRTILYSDVL